MTPDTRRLISQALAKSLAFKQCGDDAKASMWAWRLLEMLGDAGIRPEPLSAEEKP
ncbi:MAG TPA: hypothetical protein VNU68_35420 [Verrucomicrobiae bacterium]|nr:hypothetical protein [Verrucomicrobiae bacterium]